MKKILNAMLISLILVASISGCELKHDSSDDMSAFLLLGFLPVTPDGGEPPGPPDGDDPPDGDVTAPSVSSVSPEDGSIEVPCGSNITAIFSEIMSNASLTGSSFTLQEGTNPPITGTLSYSGTTATFNPALDLTPGRVYTAAITTGVTDLAGNPLTADYTWSFSTIPDHGYRDMSFSSDGMVVTDISNNDNGIYDMAIQSDGKIVVAGYAMSGSSKLFALARYNSNGSLDTTFSSDGIVTTSMGNGCAGAKAIAIQSDGKIVAVGQAVGTSGYMNYAIARYTSAGALDTDFDTDGKAYVQFTTEKNCYGHNVAIDSSGRIVIVGSELSALGNTNIAVARLTSAGALDTAFDSDGRVVTQVTSRNDEAFTVAIHGDTANLDKIVVAGYATVSSDEENFALLRYNADGTLDTGFSSDGIVTTEVGTANGYASSVMILSNGSILAGGSSSDFSIVKYTSAGALDTTFDTDGKLVIDLGGHDYGKCLAIDSGNKILFGGITEGTNRDFALVRLTQTGAIDSTFGINGIVKTPVGDDDDNAFAIAVQSDGDIVLAGSSNNGSDDDFALVRYIE